MTAMNTMRAMHGLASGRRRGRVADLAGAGAALAGIAASMLAVPGMAGVLGAGLALVMLAIAVVDARRFIIPDGLNAAGLALALVDAAATDDMAAVALALGRAAVLASTFLAIRLAYRHLRAREGIGLGDVKLAAVAGAWLDWAAMPVAVELAAVSALTMALARHVVSGQAIRRTSRLPFGLFFAPAIWLAWLLQTLWLPSF